MASAAPTAAAAAWNSAPGVVQASTSQQAIASVPMPPKRPVLRPSSVAPRRLKRRRSLRQSKSPTPPANVKFVRMADAASLPPAPAQAASPSLPAPSAARAPLQPSLPTQPAAGNAPTVNQVIAERGYWQGPADGTIVANPGAAAKLARGASKDLATGAIGPFVNPNAKAGSGLALAYADPSGNVSAPAAASQAAPWARCQRPRRRRNPFQSDRFGAPTTGAASGTSVAVKRSGNQASSTVMTANSSSVTVVKADPRLGNPWMRAIVLSPSVHRFLTTIALGVARLPLAGGDDGETGERRFHDICRDPNPA